ncbi:MAG: hypothetical protein AAGF24_06715 [Cyanobacteria bacterium P01_H01_bin.121]
MSNPHAWNPALFNGAERQQEDTGQLLIFFVDVDPPDPDDFGSHSAFERAWQRWEQEQPELAAAIQPKS